MTAANAGRVRVEAGCLNPRIGLNALSEPPFLFNEKSPAYDTWKEIENVSEVIELPQRGLRGGVKERIPSSSYGAVAQSLAIAELLWRGYEVAIPVVDNGIDLCVDYRLRVQVKAAHRLSFEPRPGYVYDRFQWSKLWGNGQRRAPVDVFVLYGNDGCERWWIVPADVVRDVAGSLNFLPNAVRGLSLEVAKYESAWHVFDSTERSSHDRT